jgi:hypothetical protein
VIKTVVVVSMPRSGSSLLSGLLHRLGVWMGREEDLSIGKHLNKQGCYENQTFISLNENILFQANMLPDISRRLEDDKEIMGSAVKSFEEGIKQAIKENEREVWGFKNPNIIYSLPYFHQYLANPYYIRIDRDIDSTVRSILRTAERRGWLPEIMHEFSYFTPGDRLKIVLKFLKLYFTKGNYFQKFELQKRIVEDGCKRIDRFLKDKRHLNIDLKELLSEPQEMIQKIAAFLEISPDQEQIQEALSFINRDLKSN